MKYLISAPLLLVWLAASAAATPAATPVAPIPESSLLDAATRAVLQRERESDTEQAKISQPCPKEEGADVARMPEIRKCQAEAYYKTRGYQHLRELFPVTLETKKIGGVYTEIFTPVGGVSSRNARRVLIDLHGGGFTGGARIVSHIESIPIAAIGKIKVLSIDYRQAPEYAFPAASEDVAAVYRELLKTYEPANIGIYGCSAGALLTSQSMAWFQKEKLPLPGAIGMLCEGAVYWTEGDSGQLAPAHGWWESGGGIGGNPYFKTTNAADSLAFPGRSPAVLAKFPPSLLIAATRDVALSSVVYTHSLLVEQGVSAELHVWEGLAHAFFFDPDLPQSRQVYAVTAKFFDSHLGT